MAYVIQTKYIIILLVVWECYPNNLYYYSSSCLVQGEPENFEIRRQLFESSHFGCYPIIILVVVWMFPNNLYYDSISCLGVIQTTYIMILLVVWMVSKHVTLL